MVAQLPIRIRGPGWTAAILALTCCFAQPPLFAQTNISDTYKVSDAMKAKLVKAGDLTLRDANFVEALFGIRRAWGVNIVVGNELKGETVSCEFVDAPLFEVLDTILGPRGYGYKPVGNSLVVMRQDAFGPLKPLFQTTTIKIKNVDPNEVKDALSVYLSEHGQILAIPSAKRLNVIDFPDRLEMIEQKAKEFDDAAKEIKDEDQAAAVEAANLAGQQNPGGIGLGNGGLAAVLPAAPPSAAYFDLNFLKVEQIGPQLMTLLGPTGRISVFAKDNRLLVVDTADRLKLVAQAIEQLDVPRPQVRIDALIYDASLEDVRRCGVNWGSTVKGNNLNAAGVAQDSIALQALTAANPAAGIANGALTFTSLGSNFDLRTVINALAQSKDSRLLSDPSVIVYDMETASFEAVTEIPYQQLTQGLGGGSIGTTAFREAGTTLTVTPQISRDQTITMNVNPRFSILAGLTPETNQPIIDRREARTTIRVQNGGTIVIGGLRQRNALKNMTKIPYLGDMKYINHLFRDKQATIRESELIVFITPTVIDMGYIGTPRQQSIHDAAMPELGTIPYPTLPDYPCPTDDWTHRCGLCGKCNKYHSGQCNGPMPGDTGLPSDEILPPPNAPALPESAPTQSPAQSQPPDTVGSNSQRTMKKGGVVATTKVSPFKSPLATRPAVANKPSSASESQVRLASNETLPPLMTPATVIKVPLERVLEPRESTSRLPSASPSESNSVRPSSAAARTVDLNLRQMRRLPPVESEAVAAPVSSPSATKANGPNRLAPARPIHVTQRPAGNSLR